MVDDDGLPGGNHDEGRLVGLRKVDLELDASEVRLDAVLGDCEGAGGEVAVEDGAVLEDLECLGAGVSNGGRDLDVADGSDLRRG